MVAVARPQRRRRDTEPPVAAASVSSTALWCPFDLGVDSLAAMVNCELVDHPVYAGLELPWFDDAPHGTGLLAFLRRRDDRRSTTTCSRRITSRWERSSSRRRSFVPSLRRRRGGT
jgi:hypothetical protein